MSATHRMAVLPHWLAVVGVRIAQAATPVAVVDSALVVKAHEWSGVDRIGKLRETILAKVNAAQPEGAQQFTALVVLPPGARVASSSRYRSGGKAS